MIKLWGALDRILHGAEHHRAYLYRIVRVVALAGVSGGLVTGGKAGIAISIASALFGVPNEFAVANTSTKK